MVDPSKGFSFTKMVETSLWIRIFKARINFFKTGSLRVFDREFFLFLVCGVEINEESEFTTIMLSEDGLEEVRFISCNGEYFQQKNINGRIFCFCFIVR